MKTKSVKIHKKARTAIVVALICVMALSCFTGCVGTKKSQKTKEPTIQSQQLSPNTGQKTDPGKATADNKQADKSKATADNKQADTSKATDDSKQADTSKVTDNSNKTDPAKAADAVKNIGNSIKTDQGKNADSKKKP